MRKIIFLDFDGVLNVGIDGTDRYGQCFHKSFVENLQWIIEKTNCDIVISSTWKMKGLLELQDMWKYRGLPGNVIDITPNEVDIVDRGICEFYDEVDRGHEIQQYIDDNKIKIYCIIDDVNDMLPNQQDRFVRTSNNKHSDCVDGYGLTVQCAEQVVEILNKNIIKMENLEQFQEIQKSILDTPDNVRGEYSDGFHSYEELYTFRKVYNAVLFNEWGNQDGFYTNGVMNPMHDVHKSWRHYDGELCFGGGWFVVVAMLPTGQITNHYEEKDWDLFQIPETYKAKYEWDGHSSSDVVNRLLAYIEDEKDFIDLRDEFNN